MKDSAQTFPDMKTALPLPVFKVVNKLLCTQLSPSRLRTVEWRRTRGFAFLGAPSDTRNPRYKPPVFDMRPPLVRYRYIEVRICQSEPTPRRMLTARASDSIEEIAPLKPGIENQS